MSTWHKGTVILASIRWVDLITPMYKTVLSSSKLKMNKNFMQHFQLCKKLSTALSKILIVIIHTKIWQRVHFSVSHDGIENYKPSHNVNVGVCESWQVSCCSAALRLRQLRHLCRYVIDDCFRWILMSLIHSRLDFGNFALVGLPVCLQQQLQSLLNAAARLVFRRITDALSSTKWAVSDVPESASSRCWSLLSSSALILITPVPGCLSYHIATVGRRSFPVATPVLWSHPPPWPIYATN